MMAYLHYPADETGYDLAASHPAINAWLGRMAAHCRAGNRPTICCPASA